MKIYQTYYTSPVGSLLLRSTNEAITALLFPDTERHAVDEDLQLSNDSELPEVMQKCIQQLDEYFAEKRQEFDLPVTQGGTAFQQSVWNALCDIKYGQTISYVELARRIGNEKSVRAVGTTNGKNQISIIVPCHRVIGANGSLTGYGGGLWRKKWLLEHEQRVAHGVRMLF